MVVELGADCEQSSFSIVCGPSYRTQQCNNMPQQLTPNSTTGLRYAKRSLMSWVVVIPKGGRARVAAPALLLVRHRLFRFFIFEFWKKILKFPFFFFWKVGVIPKEGRVRPPTPILLLVWQRLKPLGTFSRDAVQLTTSLYTRACLGATWTQTLLPFYDCWYSM